MSGEVTRPMRKGEQRGQGVVDPTLLLPVDQRQLPRLSDEELQGLLDLVEAMTDTAAQADNILAQRQALFTIGDRLKAKRLSKRQAREALDKMVGFKLELAGKKIIIDRYLTRGSYGAVFRVHEEGTEPWNIMVLKLSLPFDRSDMFVEPDAATDQVSTAEQYRKLIMEVAALDKLTKDEDGRLTRHGAVPPVPILIGAQFIPENKTSHRRIAAILMEEIDGQSLDMMNQQWDVGKDPQTLVRLGLALATGLEYIHGHGVFHSDIKLTDIQINSHQDPIYMDFGSSSVAEISKRHAQVKSGRVNYGLGEDVVGAGDYMTGVEVPSAERDIYALGVVLRKLLFGQHFNQPKERAVLLAELPVTSQQVAELTERMVSLASTDRPTLDEIIQTLKQITPQP